LNISVYFATLVEWMGVIAVTLILTTSTRFVRRPLLFKFPQREGWVSLVLIAVGSAVAAAVGIALLSRYSPLVLLTELPLRAGDLPGGVTTTLALGTAAVSLFLAVPFVLALVVRGQPLLSTGLGAQTLRPSLQLGVALALITILLTNRTSTILDGVTSSEGLGLLAAAAVGFSEEFVFRGYALPRLSAWLGERAGWVLSAALFAVWRLPLLLILGSPDPAQIAIGLGYSFLFGLILGWIQRKSGHILAPGLYHMVHNWVQVLGLF
jgi:membrane protease YdiL (CAAX protease family)